MKIKAGLLPYTLSVTFVITLFCFSLVLLSYYNNIFWINVKEVGKLELNVDSGFEYALGTDVSNWTYNDNIIIDLFGEENDSVTIVKSYWGVFDVLEVKAYKGKHEKRRKCLLGNYSDEINNCALYISNSSSLPVTLVGNTRIIGDVYVPVNGFKSGYINKKKYEGRRFVSGFEKSSQLNLPKVKPDFINKVLECINMLSSSDIELTYENNTLKNSFSVACKKIMTDNEVVINDTVLGNVILISRNKITLACSSLVTDAIFIAPEIVVESGFKGNAQLFASRKIVIEDKVNMVYPSALFVAGGEGAELSVSKNSQIEGSLIMLDLDGQNDKGGVVTLDKESVIVGQVICSGNISHRGLIYGNLTCNKLFYDFKGSVYVNYMVDCLVNRGGLQSSFLFTDVFTGEAKRSEIMLNLN